MRRFEIVFDLHRHDLLGGELVAAILAEQAHRIGAALAAMAHHIHVAFAGVLKRLQFRAVGPRWPERPKAVPCSGAEMSGMML